MVAVAILLLLLILPLLGRRWGVDSRCADNRDRFFWPNG